MTGKDERESSEVRAHSIGIRDSERVLRDERESGYKKDNRGESKVKALVRLSNGRKKALVFGPALNQKLNQPTYRTRGLEECRLY